MYICKTFCFCISDTLKLSGTENSEHVFRRSLSSPPYAGSAETSSK